MYRCIRPGINARVSSSLTWVSNWRMATICRYIRSHKSTFSEASLGCAAVVISETPSFLHPRHASQHVEHDREVQFLPAHGARSSEELVAHGGGGNGNIK